MHLLAIIVFTGFALVGAGTCACGISSRFNTRKPALVVLGASALVLLPLAAYCACVALG